MTKRERNVNDESFYYSGSMTPLEAYELYGPCGMSDEEFGRLLAKWNNSFWRLFLQRPIENRLHYEVSRLYVIRGASDCTPERLSREEYTSMLSFVKGFLAALDQEKELRKRRG